MADEDEDTKTGDVVEQRSVSDKGSSNIFGGHHIMQSSHSVIASSSTTKVDKRLNLLQVKKQHNF